jgi:beta-hydroxylase
MQSQVYPLLYDRHLLSKINLNKAQAFYTIYDYPFLKSIEDNWSVIKNEFDIVIGSGDFFQSWPQKQMALPSSDDWEVLPLHVRTDGYGQSHTLQSYAHLFPETMQLLSDILMDNLCDVTFSRLRAQTHLRPHHGRFANYLRCHLGIEIPAGDCGIIVNKEKRTWQTAKLLIFNEALEHQAWNHTDQSRVVLIFDFIPYNYSSFFPS